MSTHLVKPSGVSRLRRWGLLPRVATSGCPPVTVISVDLGDFALTASLPPVDGLREMFAPRRTVLDTILVQAAVHAGAELREPSLSRISCGPEHGEWRARPHQTGNDLRGARPDRRWRRRHAFAGRASCRGAHYDEVPTRACWYYSYWSSLALDEFRVHVRRGRYVLAFPTNDALTCILVGWPLADFHTVRAAPDEHVHAALASAAPDLAARVREGRREERYIGTADVPGYFRRPFGRGWALVGDAGYHRDPSTGWGIADAFRDARVARRRDRRRLHGTTTARRGAGGLTSAHGTPTRARTTNGPARPLRSGHRHRQCWSSAPPSGISRRRPRGTWAPSKARSRYASTLRPTTSRVSSPARPRRSGPPSGYLSVTLARRRAASPSARRPAGGGPRRGSSRVDSRRSP